MTQLICEGIAMLAYHRTYAMLKRAGHSPLKAHQLLPDTVRNSMEAAFGGKLRVAIIKTMR